MKNLILTMMMFSGSVFAGPFVSGGIGDNNVYVNCEGKLGRNSVAFEIRGTAVPTFKQGLLYSKSNNVSMVFSCKEVSLALVQNAPTAGTIEWQCVEMAQGQSEGLVKVNIFRAGVTGVTNAQITTDQIYPLPPQINTYLTCAK